MLAEKKILQVSNCLHGHRVDVCLQALLVHPAQLPPIAMEQNGISPRVIRGDLLLEVTPSEKILVIQTLAVLKTNACASIPRVAQGIGAAKAVQAILNCVFFKEVMQVSLALWG